MEAVAHNAAGLDDQQPPPPLPGSDIALELGCICPIDDNAGGKGAFGGRFGAWWVTLTCPLHGAVKALGRGAPVS